MLLNISNGLQGFEIKGKGRRKVRIAVLSDFGHACFRNKTLASLTHCSAGALVDAPDAHVACRIRQCVQSLTAVHQ